MRYSPKTFIALIGLVLAGCAGRPPQPVAVIQPQDRFMDCAAVQAEVLANNARVQDLAAESGGKVTQNVAAGVAGLFIWPLWGRPIRRRRHSIAVSNISRLWRSKDSAAHHKWRGQSHH